jgi:hypothetical protein
MNSRKLKKPILDLEKWRVYMDDIHFIFQNFNASFFGKFLHCDKKRKQLIQWVFVGKLALSYHILRKISLNFSYLEYRFQVLGSGQTKLGLRVDVHYQY